jgi:hypothetical protein
MRGEASGAVRELRPVREWGLDPMCFAHVRLLGFDLLALRPVPHMQGSFRSIPHFCQKFEPPSHVGRIFCHLMRVVLVAWASGQAASHGRVDQ